MSTDGTACSPRPWPQVPACYGWLSLDRRGRWRLQGEPVTHRGLLAFLNQHYASEEDGAWFVQNGPQRVFVRLDYTPFVLRMGADGGLLTHTEAAAGPASAVHVDDEGSVLIATAAGIGLLDDRELPAFVDECRGADGAAAEIEAVLACAGVSWRGLPVQPIGRAEVAARYGFRADPQP